MSGSDPCAFAVACGIGALLWQTTLVYQQSGGHIGDTVGRLTAAIHDDPSVSALGYDFVIGMVSLVAFRYYNAR